MPRVEANGISIEYDSVGSEGAEPVLLIAGLGIQLIGWTAPFCEMLAAQGFRPESLGNFGTVGVFRFSR